MKTKVNPKIHIRKGVALTLDEFITTFEGSFNIHDPKEKQKVMTEYYEKKVKSGNKRVHQKTRKPDTGENQERKPEDSKG